VIGDAFVPIAHQSAHDVRAHPPQSHHRYPHACLLASTSCPSSRTSAPAARPDAPRPPPAEPPPVREKLRSEPKTTPGGGFSRRTWFLAARAGSVVVPARRGRVVAVVVAGRADLRLLTR